jgi:Fe2+ transport system protein B
VDGQLRLALQVKALGLPLVVTLTMTMVDEAGRVGVKIDCESLAKTHGVPVGCRCCRPGGKAAGD